MFRTIWRVAVSGWLGVMPAFAQEPSAPAPRGATTVTGCVVRGAGESGFELIQASSPAAGTTRSPLTSTGAGTSATGATPSGSVTGETPTGSTATTTAAPTPSVGEPGATANPASPTYNRPDAASDTTGSVARPDTATATRTGSRYSLEGESGVDFAAHVGHTVEVIGKLDRSGSASSGAQRPADSQHVSVPTLRVQRLKHLSSACPAVAGDPAPR